ncbi:MAG: hypothetical protein M1608_04140 [Candidatus Omnitrophica bacterium]|nr:hypothetical protein [Candidatus Omnitrophota bacterium]
MKPQKLFITTTAAMFLFAACIPSVDPFYTDKDVVFDTLLLGEWQDKDNSNNSHAWTFEKAGDKDYKLTVREKEGKQGQFDARLFKLKDKCFLDIIPTDCSFATNQVDLVGACMFPGHLLLRVSQIEPELKLAFLNFDWLAKYLGEHPKALAHHQEEKRIILTATTSDLQAFVLEHLGEGELFSEQGVMVRKSARSATGVKAQDRP